MNNLIIGIAGGSGSGKTTLALRLKERFGEDEVRLISHDSYYKRHDELPFAERCKLNYDHPDAFDNALLIYHLQELKAGRVRLHQPQPQQRGAAHRACPGADRGGHSALCGAGAVRPV